MRRLSRLQLDFPERKGEEFDPICMRDECFHVSETATCRKKIFGCSREDVVWNRVAVKSI